MGAALRLLTDPAHRVPSSLAPLKTALMRSFSTRYVPRGAQKHDGILHVSFGWRKVTKYAYEVTQHPQDKIQLLIICGISTSAINKGRI